MEWIIAPAVLMYYFLALTYGVILKYEPVEQRRVTFSASPEDIRRMEDIYQRIRRRLTRNARPEPIEFDWRKEGF